MGEEKEKTPAGQLGAHGNGSKDSENIRNNLQKKDDYSLGYILLHRKLTNHWLFENSKFLHRWITVLFYVNHSPVKFIVGADLHTCEAGSSYRSLEDWGRLLKTNKNQVKKFFELLQKDDMIYCKILGKGNRRKHLLTVMNWDKYQKNGTGNGTRKVPRTNNEYKNEYIYNKFYDEEIKNNPGGKCGDVTYEDFVKWLFNTGKSENEVNRKLDKVLSYKDQISFKTFQELISIYGKDNVKDKIMALENDTKGKYSSFNLTLRAWLRRK